MDLIIMLVIFGVISSLTKKSKKMQQGQRRDPSSVPTRSLPSSGRGNLPNSGRGNLPNPNRGNLQSKLNEVADSDSIQGSLTSLFNMLAGEDVLKDAKAKDKERLAKLQAEEERKQNDRLELENLERVRQENLRQKEQADPTGIGDLTVLDDQIVDMGDEIQASAYGVSSEYNLSELQKGIIWKEILEKPKALRNSK